MMTPRLTSTSRASRGVADGLAVSFATFAACVVLTGLIVLFSNVWFVSPTPEESLGEATLASLKTGDILVIGVERHFMTQMARLFAHTEYIHAALVDSDNFGETVVHEMSLDYPDEGDRRIRGFATLPLRRWLGFIRDKWPGHLDSTVAVLRYSGTGGDPARLRAAVGYASDVAPKLCLNWGVHLRDTYAPTKRVAGDDELRPRVSCMHLVSTLLQRGGYISGARRPAAFTPITRLCKYEPENYREQDTSRYLLH